MALAFGGKLIKGGAAATHLLLGGAEAVGKAGRGKGRRVVEEGIEEAKALFDHLAQGGTVKPHPRVEGGFLATHTDGTTIGFRPTSKSGGLVVEIHRGDQQAKIHDVGTVP